MNKSCVKENEEESWLKVERLWRRRILKDAGLRKKNEKKDALSKEKEEKMLNERKTELIMELVFVNRKKTLNWWTEKEK